MPASRILLIAQSKTKVSGDIVFSGAYRYHSSSNEPSDLSLNMSPSNDEYSCP